MHPRPAPYSPDRAGAESRRASDAGKRRSSVLLSRLRGLALARSGSRLPLSRPELRSRQVNLGRTAQALCFLGRCTPPTPVEAPSLRSRGRRAERLPKQIPAPPELQERKRILLAEFDE